MAKERERKNSPSWNRQAVVKAREGQEHHGLAKAVWKVRRVAEAEAVCLREL